MEFYYWQQADFAPARNRRCVLADLYRWQNLVVVDAVVSAVTLRNSHYAPQNHCMKKWRHPSTKLEVQNVSQRRRRRTESLPQATCRKNGEGLSSGIRDTLSDEQTVEQTYLSRYSINCNYSKQQTIVFAVSTGWSFQRRRAVRNIISPYFKCIERSRHSHSELGWENR